MLDTNTCIYAMSAAAGFQPKLPLRDCVISIVVLGELEFGVLRSRRVDHNRDALDQWLAAVQVMDMNSEVARHYGRIRTNLAAVGALIGPNDLWIAAHAVSLGLPLITHNLREFARVQDLSVETWMQQPPRR